MSHAAYDNQSCLKTEHCPQDPTYLRKEQRGDGALILILSTIILYYAA
jgi:hypothetical protein